MSSNKSGTILLVEDEVIISIVVTKTLKRFGYNVLSINSGERAVELASSGECMDLILMDIDLGDGIDGTEAARQILKIRDIPIVFHTSHSERDMVERVRGITRYGYVIKSSGDFVLQSSIEMAFELVEAHKKVKASEEHFYEMYDRAPLGYQSLDENGYFIEVNRSWLETLGYSREEVIGKWFGDFLAPEYVDAFRERFPIFKAEGKIHSEFQMMHKNGERRFIAFEGRIGYKEDGSFLQTHCILSDFTERKEMEDKLRNSEERYSVALAAVDDGIWEWNTSDGSGFFNPRYYIMLGYADNEFTANYDKWRNLVHPDDLECVENILKGSIDNGIKFNIDLRMKMKSGEWLWVCTRGNVVEKDAAGRAIRMVGTLSDVTTRKHAELERREAEERINKLLKEKELILKEVHHRIKNNMNTINGILTLQADEVKDPLALDALNDAISCVSSMMVLYDKLYRSDNVEQVSVKEYLAALLDEIIRNFRNSGIIKIDKYIDDFMLEVRILVPLGIIVNELITNTMKYAFDGKSEGIITISASARENHVILVIEDNGVGIPESINFKNSTGFGMQLVDMLTGQIGGSIKIERGEGTRFVLEFDV